MNRFIGDGCPSIGDVPHVCGDEPKVWKRYGKNDYDNPQDDEQDGQQEPGRKFERDELDPHNETVEHLSA